MKAKFNKSVYDHIFRDNFADKNGFVEIPACETVLKIEDTISAIFMYGHFGKKLEKRLKLRDQIDRKIK